MRKPNGYWTEDKLRKIASKYKTRKEFRENNYPAYLATKNKGREFLDFTCKHMKRLHLIWDEKLLIKEAKKFGSRKAFERGCPNGYAAARRKKILDKICKHMKPQGDILKRFVYAFVFDDRYVYVGLTCNIKKRYEEHIKPNNKPSPVYKHIKKCKKFKFKLITKNPINGEDAQELEHKTKLNYKKGGYKLLNTGVTGVGKGSLGRHLSKYSDNLLKTTALKYTSKRDFSDNDYNLYYVAYRKGKKYLDNICKHMKPLRLVYTDEILIKTALKYKTKSDFRRYEYNSYQAAKRKGKKYLDNICKHMVIN